MKILNELADINPNEIVSHISWLASWKMKSQMLENEKARLSEKD